MKISILTVAMAVGGAVCGSIGMRGQAGTVDHFSQEQLIKMAHELDAKASSGSGNASKKLAEYPNHFTMIALREKSGGGEVHENFADFLFIVEGKARLITGGTVKDGKSTGPGEILGSSVEKGVEQALSKGDVVHIPAGVPHQMMLEPGEELIYFVIKVKEK